MDAIRLLTQAQSAGLTVSAEGNKLIVRGPRSAEVLAMALLELKPEIMGIISNPVRLCRCQPPMPKADLARQSCWKCRISCWCIVCDGCRWCSFEEKWGDCLVKKRSSR